MGHEVFSLTLMAITHLAVDDSALVRYALTLNMCSNIADIGPRSKNIRRSFLSFLPTPPKL